MQYNPEEFKDILNIFKAESEELIQELNDGFLLLEKNPENKQPLKKLFQLAHSLKGAARMLGFNSIQDIAHKLEDILSYWKKDNVVINMDSFQVIYEVCDFLNELIETAVNKQSDSYSEKVLLFVNKLDNYIVQNHMIPAKQPEKLPENYISVKSIDINALILELIFVLENENLTDNKEDIIPVISENLKQLADIFNVTDYIPIKDKIHELLQYLDSEEINKLNIELVKQKIIEIKDSIYNIYKELNINNAGINKVIKKQNENKVNEKTESPESKQNEKQINDKFSYILSNLSKIKYEKGFIREVCATLKNIKDNVNDKKILLILSKTINILELFMNKDIVIDNDCYMVILQCIYLARKISLNEKEENINNLNFLIQRLSVVEDMFNISDTIPKHEMEMKDSGSVISADDYTNLKKNLKSIDLQEIKTLRVDTSKLDNLISRTGELLINGIKTREHIVELSKINSKLIKWGSVSKKIINYLKYLEKKGFFNMDSDDSLNSFYKKAQGFFINNADMINEINNDFTDLYNMISEDDNKLHQTAIEIETIAKGIRVLPLATIFHSFPRMIRDIAKENNKKIDFIVSGSDTTVDKKIIEEIKMPLIHILRNAVSHGIEFPDERIKNNKNENGIVKLSAKQAENNVIISIEDDGYGINIEKVKETAIKKGLLTEEEIEGINNEQLMKLLFLPGFSTEDSITEISGRGIGLDVVKTKITNLSGEIFIDSVLGKGCRVTIKLPLSMSTIKTFILLINNQKYAIPVNSIKFVKKIRKDEIFRKNGENCIIFNEHSIPVFYLSEVLGEDNKNIAGEKQYTVIILETQDREAAFVVDKLLGDQEVFQKKLIPPILKIRNISGFTTLSTGEICLLINPYELIRNAIIDVMLPPLPPKQLIENHNAGQD